VLYPVTGKVTVQGKPLATAVVTFLQVDEKGTTSVGETDADGVYDLSYGGKPGAAAAKYKVAISYIMGTDGTVYGLDARSGLSKPYGLVTGKELIPPEWSNLGKTTHLREVPEKGGTFNFNIEEGLLPAPVAETPANVDGSGKAAAPEGPKPEPSPAEGKTSSTPTPPAPAQESTSAPSAQPKAPDQ